MLMCELTHPDLIEVVVGAGETFPATPEQVEERSRHVEWDQCDAYARSYNEGTGRERELTCSLGRHAAPGDATEKHYDPDLDVYWLYADGDDQLDFG